MSAHAKFPPSGAERWMKCGYSIKMAPFYPPTTNKAAEEGTRQHAIAAMHLENGTEPGNQRLRTYTENVRGTAEANEGTILVEHKVVIVPDLCEGTLDAAVIWKESFSLKDLKWGKSPVHATDNKQLMLYGIGLLREYPMPRSTEVELSIVQPNVSSGWPVKRWWTTVGHLLDFRPKVMEAIEEGLKDNPKAVAGSWCYWCPAKLHCQAYLLHTASRR